jgi:arsenite methyltransferase
MRQMPDPKSGAKYFDMQGAIGITKHPGGRTATQELLALCHIDSAREVLDVGCGIGVGPARIAKTFGCRVVGVDVSEQMIQWARLRARQEHVEDLVELRTADVLDLPYPDDRFDLVICESVLAFVNDKGRAIQELRRVAKPNGYIGLNEGLWLREPPPEMVERVKGAIGPEVPNEQEWRDLWGTSGLEARVVRVRFVDPVGEVRSRISWVGWHWMLRAWGRALMLFLRDPSIRQSIKQQFDVPMDVFEYAGYGLFVGRKPVHDTESEGN